MPDTAIAELNLQNWDTISASYQAGARIATDGIHYDPLALGEQELCSLGDVCSKQVIEIGYGGCLNAIAFTRDRHFSRQAACSRWCTRCLKRRGCGGSMHNWSRYNLPQEV